jgi:hypothetical protein
MSWVWLESSQVAAGLGHRNPDPWRRGRGAAYLPGLRWYREGGGVVSQTAAVKGENELGCCSDNVAREKEYLARHSEVTVTERNGQSAPLTPGIWRAVIDGSNGAKRDVESWDLGSLLDVLIKITGW